MVCCGMCIPAGAQTVLYSNGPYITGTTAASGAAAPAGMQWSELGKEGQAANGLYGAAVTAGASAQPRAADDFVVPPNAGGGAGWHVQHIRVIAFETNENTSSSPFTAMTVRIFDGPPTGGTSGGQVVFGDETTNRLHSTAFTGVYRIPHSTIPITCGGTAGPSIQLNRPLMEVVATVNHTLPPGTYWFDVNLTGTLGFPSSVVTTTALNTRQVNPASNAYLRTNGNWLHVTDNGVGCQPAALRQELVFDIIGTEAAGGCYPNCDGSSQPPVLNVADFSCFLQRFAAAHPYANCDQSTQPPVLNVADFSCFLQKFAAGCF
jgi:hypothetical protein